MKALIIEFVIVACWTLLMVCNSTSSSDMSTTETIAELRNESKAIEHSCAHDFNINERLLTMLKSPIKLSVLRNPKHNVQCFARCMIDRFGYYQYHVRDFDVERLVEVTTAQGLTENQTRYYADKCKRIAWNGDENCEDFWNVYRCFRGAV